MNQDLHPLADDARQHPLMRRYDLDSLLADTYQHVPADGYRPVVGITGNYDEQTCRLAEGYYRQVEAAGATPVILPPLSDRQALTAMLDHIDALLLSGGADINPLFSGEQPSPRLGGINDERDVPELLLTRLAYNRLMPILGICRGIQTLAVALGGRVAQDIGTASDGTQQPSRIKHSQEARRHVATHTVAIAPGTTLHRLYAGLAGGDAMPAQPCTGLVGGDTIAATATGTAATAATAPIVLPVNSFHHQAVSDPGPQLRVVATAPDGVIEAVESTAFHPLLAVQWHPECMGDDGLPLFRWLADEARRYHDVQTVHDRLLTLDTHCDTPMFFPQGVDFARRDDRLLVDLPKMTEGRLDATIMVAYLPQNATYSGTHQQFADDIFDRIAATVASHPQHLALARTPADLWANKRAGRKSIMLGIENGLALDHSLDTLRHFARRGVVYITLCHNGDNDLCDSARGEQTHGGVSDFGAEVIREMNRLGLMVDLSHAAESSFYDALDISQQPIVCSHSSARALCDHPRNLTDDQMRALASKGGVCQITLYPGFLTPHPSAPTLLDAMAHLDHAIQVMGIEHVGLGTDFDGDGGVPGLASAAELTNFTRQLLARRYSEADIQLIWGGNFLRVMEKVQHND